MELLLLLLSLSWISKRWFWSNSLALTTLTTAFNSFWICIGDFNEVLNQREKRGIFVSLWPNRLRDFMDDSQALDLDSMGIPFTYTGKRKKEHLILNKDLIEFFMWISSIYLCLSQSWIYNQSLWSCSYFIIFEWISYCSSKAFSVYSCLV